MRTREARADRVRRRNHEIDSDVFEKLYRDTKTANKEHKAALIKKEHKNLKMEQNLEISLYRNNSPSYHKHSTVRKELAKKSVD